jgi:hypothetical protein
MEYTETDRRFACFRLRLSMDLAMLPAPASPGLAQHSTPPQAHGDPVRRCCLVNRTPAWLMAAVLVNAGLTATASAENEWPSATPGRVPPHRQPLDTGAAPPDTAVPFALLTADLTQLQRDVQAVAEAVGSLSELLRDAQIAGVDLSGGWQLHLPAGFEYPVTIARCVGRHEHLQLDVRTNMRGTYRRDGRFLRVAEADDERLTEFVWEAISPDLFVLVESPPVAKIGSDYRGAELRRVRH